jgi:hypothetical protein
MSALEYLFGPQKDSRGRAMPFSRFDVALSVVLGLTLLVAISYNVEPHKGWTRLRIVIVLGGFVVTTLIAQHRRIVFGCALGIVTMRLVMGVFSSAHPLFLLIPAVVGATATWLLLKDTR